MWLFTRGYPIQLELHFWCRKSLRFLRVNHDRQRAIGTQLNVKLWKYHGKSMENMDHMFINMFINSIYMWNSWKIHGTSMEHPWNIHGTSMEHPAFLEDFHAQPPLGHDVRSSRQQWREGHGHHRGGDLELAVPAMIVPSVIYYH